MKRNKKGLNKGSIQKEELLLKIIKAKANCEEIKERDCYTCWVFDHIGNNYSSIADAELCSCVDKNNMELRQKIAVEIYIEKYSKEDLVEALI